MSKRYATFITVLFCAFLGVFAVLHWAIPDREFSQNENRSLEQLPTPVFLRDGELFEPVVKKGEAAFFSGDFMSKFETYFTDQFPARDWFISLKAASEVALGKTENNDVFYGKNDTLYAKVPAPEEGEVDKRVGYVDRLAENLAPLDVPVYFSLVPNKLDIEGDKLNDPPAVALFNGGGPLALSVNYLGEDLWARAAQTRATWVDLRPEFESRYAAGDELFYRTDHHWTSLGAYYAYTGLMEAMGETPVPLDSLTKTTVTEDFLGTTWSSVGAGWIEPDHIDAYVPEDGVTVTVEKGYGPEKTTMYHPEQLEVKDKYAYFLGGNQPLYVLKREGSTGPKVLVVRDSYSDSLAPFLTLNCSEVHLFDPRYNRMPISAYVQQNGIDSVVVLYSMANFVTDNNLSLMGL